MVLKVGHFMESGDNGGKYIFLERKLTTIVVRPLAITNQF